MSTRTSASFLALVVLAGLLGCATPKKSEPLPVVKVAPAERPAMTIYRDELDDVLQRGLQPLIADLNLRPALQDGRFQGWRVRFLKPGEAPYRDSAVRPGDIVTAVNGKSIERPDQMMTVWKSLRSATELRFSILRAGEAQDLVYAIRRR